MAEFLPPNVRPERPRFASQQVVGWQQAVADLIERGAHVPAHAGEWQISYSDEAGQGGEHHIDATFVDGEVLAQIVVDVYGHFQVSFADITWIHVDADEECWCVRCRRET